MHSRLEFIPVLFPSSNKTLQKECDFKEITALNVV